MTIASVTEFDNEFTDPRRCILLNVSQLVIDTDIQRTVKIDKRDRLAHEWNWDIAEVVTVVELANGKYRVVEGQHRTEAIRIRNPLASVWCVIIMDDLGADSVTEAEVAYGIQAAHKPHSAIERWNLNVKQGKPHEILAEEVIANHGLRLGTGPSVTTIIAVAAIKSIISDRKRTPENGADLLDRTLWVVIRAWPEHDATSGQSRFTGNLLKAIAEVITRNSGYQRERLVETLRSKMAARWIEDVASSNGPKIESIAVGIMSVYNRHKQYKARLTWLES